MGRVEIAAFKTPHKPPPWEQNNTQLGGTFLLRFLPLLWFLTSELPSPAFHCLAVERYNQAVNDFPPLQFG